MSEVIYDRSLRRPAMQVSRNDVIYMIRLLEHKNINKQKWDNCIRNSSNACIFVYSWYLDIVCEDWCALVLNDYEAVFPLAGKSKYKIHYVYQPFFTRYFGSYAHKSFTTLTTDFFNAIPSKYSFLEFCIHESDTFKASNAKTKERRYQQLTLNSSYETLQKKYSDNAKRNIKKALKAGFQIKQGIKPEQIVDLFKSTKGQELEVFKPDDYKTLVRLMNSCMKQNNAESLAVYDRENKLCAAGFFMKSDDRFVFLKSGVTEYGKTNGAMHLLFDTFIKQHSGTNQILDFGGSSINSVARFYKNFGAKDCVYLQIRKNNLPRLLKWMKD